MKHFLILFFTFALNLVFAQPRVITIESSTETQKEEKQETTDHVQSFTTSPIEFFTTDFGVYYERKLSSRFSLEVGTGLTYGEVILTTIESGYRAVLDNLKSTKLGYSFSTAIKFYTYEVFDGTYFSLEYKLRNFRSNTQYPSLSGNRTLTHNLIRLGGGYVVVLPSNFKLDFYFDVLGRISKNKTIYDSDMKNDFYGTGEFGFGFNAGVKLGFTF